MFTRKFLSKKVFTQLCAIVLLFFLSVYTVKAAGVPTIFSFQGRLADSSGNLLGGSGTIYYFKFSIWDVATGGATSTDRLWPTSAPGIATSSVRQGVFNINIGDIANGFPDTLDYNFNTNKNIYLQIEVSSTTSNFQALSPRQRISSAPFAQISGAVSGTGQSSFGTTTPFSNAVVSIEATATSSIPVLIRAAVGQVADLFKIVDSSLSPLFTINSNGNVGIGTAVSSRKLNVFDVNNDFPQLRFGQSSSTYGELYTDLIGDVRLSSTGGNFRMGNANLFVCSGDFCDVATTTGEGNIIVENAVIFDNKFKLKQTGTSTMILYDSIGSTTIEFDEGQ